MSALELDVLVGCKQNIRQFDVTAEGKIQRRHVQVDVVHGDLEDLGYLRDLIQLRYFKRPQNWEEISDFDDF